MKKLLLILICALVVATLCLPNVALAETKVANDVHFIAPTGMALVGDYLLISDNVADNQSAILCFDIANGNAHVFTHLLDKQAVNMTSSNGRLFVIFADCFVEYEIADDKKSLEVVETFNFPKVIDVCISTWDVIYQNNPQEKIYFLQDGELVDSLKYIDYKTDGSHGEGTTGITIANGVDCVALSNASANDKGDFVYVSGKNADGKNAIVRWNGVLGSDISNDPLNKNGVVYAGNFALLGIATNNRDYPVVYGAKSMFNLNYIQSANNHFSAEQGFEDFGAEEHDIVKVASSTTHLVILNDNNQLQVYQLVDGADGSALSATHTVIGSDQVKTAVPTTYTGFTLAKSSGYPTNIIYKTNDADTSIESILTKDQVTEFVILDYAGAENSGYYYVFVNGKFGWIKKSDNATTPDTDAKIEIVNTKVSDKVTYNAKFNSLGKVYVYDLPCSNDNIRKLIDTVEQTGDEMTEVKILQQFKEENITWYYVEYLEGKRGFVKSTDIGQFTATYVGPMDAVVDKQINASLFNAVTLHMTKELSADSMFSFDGINPVKLYSGDWVKLIEVDEEAGAALIQVVCENGETAFGWVESSRLVEIDAITTNAIVGFVGLGIAVILAIIFASVFISRKKKVRK